MMMENNKRSKIEIIDVNININIDDEIKKQTNIDESMRTKINDIIMKAKTRQERPVDNDKIELYKKFESLFTTMSSSNALITKDDFANYFGIAHQYIGAYILRFRKFLKEVKNNEWALIMGKDERNQRTYMLKRYQ